MELKVCAVCGGQDIQTLRNEWVMTNTGEYVSDGPEEATNTWCEDCQDHTNQIMESEFKERVNE